MITRSLRNLKTALLVMGCSTAMAATSLRAADFVFNVDLNTAALNGAPNGPFFLDFQLNQGTSTLSSSATITNFSYAGGSPVAGGNPFGTATGDIASTLSLSTATSAFNEYFQGFTAGTTDIKFTVDLTNTSTGTTPDGFFVSILDSEDLNPQIATNNPDGLSLVAVTLGGPSFPPNATLANNVVTGDSIGADAGVTATVSAAAVPEPSTWALALACAGAFAFLRRRMGNA